MGDYQEIMNTIARLFAAADRCDWETIQGLMTDPVHLDYSYMGRGDPADISPKAVTDGWATVLPGYDAMHHQIGSQIVEIYGDTALALCHGTATHFMAGQPGGETAWIIGTYRIKLVCEAAAWKISSFTFLFKFRTGDPNLADEAAKRVAANQMRPPS